MPSSKMTKMIGGVLYITILMLSGPVYADYTLNMTQSVTAVGHDVYDLHMLVLWIVTIVGVVVFAVIIYSLINHRKSKGASPANFHESAIVEFIWTIIPFVILVGIAVPATRTLLKMEDTVNPDLTIKVTGWQWMWEYEYLDNGVHFFSKLDKASNRARQRNSDTNPRSVNNYLLEVDNAMVVPVNKKVRILTTSNDVIHSWWVPALAVKRDAIPGYINASWFEATKTGVYRGQCAQLCGKGHGFMPIVVKVVGQDEYDLWVEKQKSMAIASADRANKIWNKAELMMRGKHVYHAFCVACHQANGRGIPGTYPALAGSKIATGPLDAHIDIVVNGKPGTAMQAFGAQLNAADIAAVISFERNAFGNNTGDIVQPSKIMARPAETN